MIKHQCLWFCILVLQSFLLNCGGSAHEPTEHYFLVATNVKLPYWQAAGSGLVRAATELKVRADFVGPDTYDPKAQQQEFLRVAKLKPAGILVSPADPTLMKPDIDAAIESGIPVVTIDSDAPDSKRLLFIGTNNYQAGLMGGQLTAKLMHHKGNVVVFSMPEQANLNQRLHGYRDAFAEHPQIKIVEVVNIKGDPRIAFDTANELLEKGKVKPDAFVCLEAIAGKEVAEVLNRRQLNDKTLVAMDTDPGTLEWVEKGMIAATIAQKPYTMAFYGLKVVDELHHHPLHPMDRAWAQDPFSPIPAFIDTGAMLVNKTNVADFMKERQQSTGK